MACESQARDAESVTQIVEPAARRLLDAEARHGDEEGRRTLATITLRRVKYLNNIVEPNRVGAWLWWLLDSPTNAAG
jgi:hypothetical protein